MADCPCGCTLGHCRSIYFKRIGLTVDLFNSNPFVLFQWLKLDEDEEDLDADVVIEDVVVVVPAVVAVKTKRRNGELQYTS